MADKKISELDAITGANTAATDAFVVVDTSTGQTKKITREELNNAIEQDVLSTVDINGGTIDGTTIGGATPAAGSFTTVGATGNITVGGTVDGRDVATDGTKLDGIEASATADQTGAEIATALNGETISSLTALTTTGAVIVGGDFTVNGTTTTINSTTLEVDDKNIVLASGAADAAAANGSGITIDGASATFTYVSTGDKWQLNKPLDVGGDVTFGDSEKAIFGAGTDLQIYHDGSNSAIQNSTGELFVYGGGDQIRIRAENGEESIVANPNGSVDLYHNGSVKLTTSSTGIDVTGTVTADGLTVDGDASTFNSTNANTIVLKRGGGSDLNTAIHFDQSTADTYLGTDTGNSLVIGRALNLGASRTAKFDQNGDISFYEDTGTTAKLFWDASAESLGIGTSSPDMGIHLSSGSTNYLRVTNTSTGVGSDFGTSATGTEIINRQNAPIRFQTNATERLRITAGGSVGIGTSSPSTKLHVLGNALVGDNTDISMSSTADGQFRVDGDGYSGAIALNANGMHIYHNSSVRYISFGINETEEMRLETDGDLHVDGNVVAYSTTISDIRLKKDIAPIEDALTKVQQLNGCTFTYLKDDRQSAGLIAQDLEKVLPSAVIEDEAVFHGEEGETYKTVQYDQVIGLLVEAVKELKAEIEELKNGTAK